MAKFKKKPVVVDAEKWDGTLEDAWRIHGLFGHIECSLIHGKAGLFCNTLEGQMSASSGDYIIRGVKGEVYPCKPDIFVMSYEPVRASVT